MENSYVFHLDKCYLGKLNKINNCFGKKNLKKNVRRRDYIADLSSSSAPPFILDHKFNGRCVEAEATDADKHYPRCNEHVREHLHLPTTTGAVVLLQN